MDRPLGWRLPIGGTALIGVVACTAYQARGVPLDFPCRYAAGELVAEGTSPYDAVALVTRTQELGSNNLFPFHDAPPMAAVMRIVAWLPLQAAAYALVVGSLLSCVALGWLLAGRDRHRWVLVTVGFLVFTPARFAILSGQTDLVVLALAAAFGGQQPVLAILKPQTAISTVATLFGRRFLRTPWRALATASIGFLAVGLATALLASAARWSDWLDTLGDHPAAHQGVDGWRWLVFVVGLVVLAWGAWTSWVVRTRRRQEPVDLLCVAACASGMLAITGGWHPQWFVSLAFPLAALLLAVDRREVTLQPHQQALLAIAAAAAAGEGMFWATTFGLSRAVAPVVIFSGFLVALVAWQRLRPLVALAVLATNAAIAVVPLSLTQRTDVSMSVAVVLLYLTFSVAPRPFDLRGGQQDDVVAQAA